jgi:hypothetical protein
VTRDIVKDAVVFAGLVAIAIATRLIALEPNFHAVTAASLFAGFYFRRAATAACLTLLTMTLSDWVIGGYHREVMLAVYGSLMLPIAWRGLLRSRLTGPRVAVATATSSVLFFLITNAAVWHASRWYAPTLEGLAACYIAALPFFVNALMGDLLFSGLLFGAYALVARPHGLVAPRAWMPTR